MVTAPGPEESHPLREVGERVVRAYRDVLAVPGARALIGASAASQTGNWLYNAALLGYVYSATHSAVWVCAATICRFCMCCSARGRLATGRRVSLIVIVAGSLACASELACNRWRLRCWRSRWR